MSKNIYLIHELLECFNCKKLAYHLHTEGCQNIIQASYLREQIRVINKFISSHNYVHKDAFVINKSSLQEAATVTLEVVHTKKMPKILHAVLVHNNISVYIPYMMWHNTLKGWVFYIPSASMGPKQEHLQYTSFITIICDALKIPVAKVLLATYQKTQESTQENWIDIDILGKSKKYFEKERRHFHSIIDLINSEHADDLNKWESCNKQYCAMCEVEKEYAIDDVRTLRKAKLLIDHLIAQNIEKITEIPPELLPNNSIINRQYQSVSSMNPLLISEEVHKFVSELQYPIYYLDFEAFNTSIPYSYPAPYVSKNWGYNVFLYSIQWQNNPKDIIHTQLWAMLPGQNQIAKLWQSLKEHLTKAGSVVVYGSQFERDMINQLASTFSENKLGESILKKVVDLQALFFNLSLYHPEQKGKISLKTITPVWLSDQSYSDYKVNEGVSANYYFVSLTDKVLGLFDNIKDIAYIKLLFEKIQVIEDASVELKDIADYCKYDTEVMIRLVTKIEQLLDKINLDGYIS